MSTPQQPAPERIWIDPSSCMNYYGTTPDNIQPDETEYIRADLHKRRAIEFAGWCHDHDITVLTEGDFYQIDNEGPFYSAGDIYSAFLQEKNYGA